MNSLNASLLADYYNITECDSLFSLLSHLHSGSDISGGTLRADQIRIGSSETSQIIYFYENGSEVGEFIAWHDSNDRFWVSEDIYIEGTITIPTTTRYYSIPGSAWLPYQDAYAFTRNAGYIHTTTLGITTWWAPVNLPHGAVVTEFRAWVWDGHGTDDIDVYLYRQTGNDVDVMASVASSGSLPWWQWWNDTSIDYATINNEDYAYVARGNLRSGSSSHALSRVRITYTIEEPLP